MIKAGGGEKCKPFERQDRIEKFPTNYSKNLNQIANNPLRIRARYDIRVVIGNYTNTNWVTA